MKIIFINLLYYSFDFNIWNINKDINNNKTISKYLKNIEIIKILIKNINKKVKVIINKKI